MRTFFVVVFCYFISNLPLYLTVKLLDVYGLANVLFVYQRTDKICAFFLEWKFDPTYSPPPLLSSLSDSNMSSKGGHQFRLVKQDEKLSDLISEELGPSMTTTATGSLANMKSVASTNRLIHKHIASFVKNWEVNINT
jgi:hypothetical protein